VIAKGVRPSSAVHRALDADHKSPKVASAEKQQNGSVTVGRQTQTATAAAGGLSDSVGGLGAALYVLGEKSHMKVHLIFAFADTLLQFLHVFRILAALATTFQPVFSKLVIN